MNARELLKGIIYQENELYNLYKLGETFATYERPSLVPHFAWLASEELRHRKTAESFLEEETLEDYPVHYFDSLEIEPYFSDERAEPASIEDLILEALIREKHAYELYSRLSEILGGTLGELFSMMASEELKHAYRLKVMYEGLP